MGAQRIGRWTVAALLAALLLWSASAGAGPSPAGRSGVAEVALYKGPDRQAKLEAGARAEGALFLYTSMDLEESTPIVEVFKKKYPFITQADIYRASGEDVAQKIITEYRGRKYLADIFEGTGIDVAKMIKEGYGQTYYTSRAGAFPRQAKDPKGFWVASRYNILAAAWNTTLAGISILVPELLPSEGPARPFARPRPGSPPRKPVRVLPRLSHPV